MVDTLGTAKILRRGSDATILALALMVPRALAAAERLQKEHGIDCEVIDVRSLVPLDTQTILASLSRTHRLFTVEAPDADKVKRAIAQLEAPGDAK